MNTKNIINIQKAQNKYLELLLDYEEIVKSNSLSMIRICQLLDEIKYFWLERLNIIEFELDELADNKMCFALFGAPYLNVSEYEHYYFKSFGDIQIIPDPFLNMDYLFRIPQENLNKGSAIDFFKKAYLDTIEVLTTYKGYFLILPINEIVTHHAKNRQEWIDAFFWTFISSIFNLDLRNSIEFNEKFHTFEDIEKGLIGFVRDHLIFNDFCDIKTPLRSRIQQYQNDQALFSAEVTKLTETQIFLISVYSYVAQVADLLFTCSILRLNPYIRFDVLFSYLALVMHTFIDDTTLREMIEKSVICYIFRKKIDSSVYSRLHFSDYCQRLERKPIMNNVVEKIHNAEINILEDETDRVVSIIEGEFQSLLKD